MKKLLMALAVLALATPLMAQEEGSEWDIVGTADAIYVGQHVNNPETGIEQTEFVLAGTLGVGAWRKTPFPINIGARIEVAAVPDEQDNEPHIAVGGSLMFGNDTIHGSVGTLLDQDEWLLTVGVGATF